MDDRSFETEPLPPTLPGFLWLASLYRKCAFALALGGEIPDEDFAILKALAKARYAACLRPNLTLHGFERGAHEFAWIGLDVVTIGGDRGRRLGSGVATYWGRWACERDVPEGLFGHQWAGRLRELEREEAALVAAFGALSGPAYPVARPHLDRFLAAAFARGALDFGLLAPAVDEIQERGLGPVALPGDF